MLVAWFFELVTVVRIFVALVILLEDLPNFL